MSSTATVSCLAVEVREQQRLVRLDQIREIVAMCEPVPVHEPTDAIRAVMNLRGEIVPLLETSTRDHPFGPTRFVVVTYATPERTDVFGLVVDDVKDLVEVPADQMTREGAGPRFARVGDQLFPMICPFERWQHRHDPVDFTPIGHQEEDASELLKRRASRYGARTASRSIDRIDHVIFDRAGSTFGIQLTALREIQIVDRFCPVPGASPVVPGLVHFRGELLSLHDVAPYLEDSTDPPPWRWLLIVEHARQRLGLMADDVQGISTLQGDEIGEVPLALGEKASCFAGIADGNRLLLDPSGLFETPTFYLATSAQENP